MTADKIVSDHSHELVTLRNDLLQLKEDLTLLHSKYTFALEHSGVAAISDAVLYRRIDCIESDIFCNKSEIKELHKFINKIKDQLAEKYNIIIENPIDIGNPI